MAASTMRIRIAVVAAAAGAMAACDAFEHVAPIDADSFIDDAPITDAAVLIDAPADSRWGDGSGPPRCVMPGGVTVREGDTASFSISLGWAPRGTSPAILTLSDTTVAALTPPALSFTPSNWSVPQAVTLETFHDADAFDENLAMGCSTGNTTENLFIRINDDEEVTIVLEPAQIVLTEGATGVFRVTLSTPPQTNAVLMATPNDPSAVAASPPTFVFTPANWSTPQILTVVALQDADAFDENTAVTIGGSSILARAASVAINDDD